MTVWFGAESKWVYAPGRKNKDENKIQGSFTPFRMTASQRNCLLVRARDSSSFDDKIDACK
jgi:hypothetical protein